MNRKSLIALVLVLLAGGIVATHARQDAQPDVKKWDVGGPTGPTTTPAEIGATKRPAPRFWWE